MVFAIKWLGPLFFEDKMRALGFSALDAYKSYWIERCTCFGLPADIDRYWHESAKEFVASGGYGSGGSSFFRGAHIGEPGVYRSPYLDELEQNSPAWVKPGDIAPALAIHPCTYYFLLKMRSNAPEAWDPEYEELMERAKLEGEHIAFPVDRPLQSVADVEYYLSEAADFYGFLALNLEGKMRSFGKVGFFMDCAAYDLRIVLACDSKKRHNSLPHPLVEAFIYDLSSPDLVRNLNGFKAISPTMLAYSNFISSQAGVINIYATLAAAKVFLESLD